MPRPTKICYILPEYSRDTDTHFYHHYEFLEELSKKLGIFLIAEKSKNVGRATSYIKRVYRQKFSFLPLRFLESFLVILCARMLGYKIFYTHYCYIGAINAAIISRIFGGKSYYWNCAMNWLFKQRTLPGLGYRLSLKLSHFLVTGSEKMKKEYAEHYDLPLNRIKVVPNWINLNRFNRGDTQMEPRQVGDTQKYAENHQRKSAKPKVLLFVHWLSKRKGADVLVSIVKQLKQNFKVQIPNFKLLVVGDGPHKKTLEKEIKENKLEKYIEVVGKVPNKDLPEYYSKADLFIMPSMEEGFPRVLLEAMAVGIPYVASDVGAVREISPETAQRFLVKPGDVEKFVHKIGILLTDKKIYNKFRKEELEHIKKYSLEKVLKEFVKLFD